jgi:hypothetical protein
LQRQQARKENDAGIKKGPESGLTIAFEIVKTLDEEGFEVAPKNVRARQFGNLVSSSTPSIINNGLLINLIISNTGRAIGLLVGKGDPWGSRLKRSERNDCWGRLEQLIAFLVLLHETILHAIVPNDLQKDLCQRCNPEPISRDTEFFLVSVEESSMWGIRALP